MLTANLLSVIITVAALAMCYACRRRVFRDFDIFIRRAALIVFIAGFCVYFVGFRSGHESVGTQLSWYASFFRPLLSSMEMFAFHSDLLEVGEPCHHSMVYMTIFSVVHFAAAAVSFAVAINYLGVRFRSAWRWRKLQWHKRLPGNVHIFFGINNISLQLAHDIHKYAPADTLIFINAPQEASNSGLLGLTSIFNVFGFRREVVASIDRLNGIIKQTRMPIQMMEGNRVISQLGLDSVLNKTKEFMRLYLLYEDDLQNLAKNIKLRNDEFFNHDMGKKAYIYCRATVGKLNGGTSFEYNSRCGAETILVDASRLSVKSMMCTPEAHPANFVDFDYHTGLAKSVAHYLIIGFGETGQEAFKFLYEHGNFVYPDTFNGHHAVFHIVDPKANQKKGFFEMRYPCLSENSDNKLLDVDIQWHNHSAGDGRFWDLMKEIKDELNYVVIATGSDNRDIAITYDLGEYALRWRKRRMENFALVVRCYKHENESRFDELVESCIDGENGRQVVRVIGKISDSFTHRYIWEKCLERDAAIYSATSGANFGRLLHDIRVADAEDAFTVWWKRHSQAKGNPIAYSNLKRMETQEFSDASHIFAKLKSIGLIGSDNAIGTENLQKLRACRTYADFEQLPFFTNLMRLEHLRCLASHICMGYTPMSMQEFEETERKMECDVIRHKSLNLVTYDQLDKMPVAEWLNQAVPAAYSEHANLFLLAHIVQTSLAIGLDKLGK